MKPSRTVPRAAAMLFLLLFLCCGCTKQRNMDIPEFCKRYNAATNAETLSPDAFFSEPAEAVSEYNCHIAITENLTALLTLTTDSSGTVTNLQLTCIPEGGTYNADTFVAVYETYTALCAVLTVQDVQTADAAVRAAGILPENIGFTPFGFVGEAEKHRYSVFSGEQYLSLFCERI